jgi:glycosyltransferase involved in cell wall biosynthesis
MKILHLCTYDRGGAGNAALRLHRGLLTLGVESVFCSREGTAADPTEINAANSPLKKAWYRQVPRLEYHFARWSHPLTQPVLPTMRLPGCGLRAIQEVAPDLVNLHWVEHGLIPPRDLGRLVRMEIPLVWTLHDMSPLTGGFGFREVAGLPPTPFGPLVSQDRRQPLSERILERTRQSLRQARLTVVSPSRWLAEEAKQSPVFSEHDIRCIPYGVDETVFHPMDRAECRKRWDLPSHQPVILFGADTFSDSRKGLHHLQAALGFLTRESGKDAPLLVGFGNHDPIDSSLFPVPVRGIGRVSDAAELASLYSAADVFACPSREDNLPNTMLESLACGTPVVGFQVGGLMDFVIEGQTGGLATCFNENELAIILDRVLTNASSMRPQCRQTALDFFPLKRQALAYRSLYQEMLS